MLLNFADFIIQLKNPPLRMNKIATEYFIDAKKIDFTIDNNEKDIELEQSMSDEKHQYGYLNFIHASRKLAEWLPLHNAFVLHSACFDVGGDGVVFAAHSGTGKTTHMLLWQKLLGDKMTIVNGDKPIVRFFEDEPDIPYAYGTPWNGKEQYGCNMRTPVKHICFIERSETNYVEKMKPAEIIDLIFNQVYMPKDPMAVVNTMQLINRFINCCSIWKIHCNMDISAAEVAYNTIFGNENK